MSGFILAYAAVLGMLVYTSRLLDYALLAVVAFSVVSYLLYWKDKRAARQGRWRTPESTLHFLSLLGGWPGAMIAQRQFRHKSSKPQFRAIFYITVFLNIIAVAWLAFYAGETYSLMPVSK